MRKDTSIAAKIDFIGSIILPCQKVGSGYDFIGFH
jgi:hypothetical protein